MWDPLGLLALGFAQAGSAEAEVRIRDSATQGKTEAVSDGGQNRKFASPPAQPNDITECF